jgi:hypothetical protein
MWADCLERMWSGMVEKEIVCQMCGKEKAEAVIVPRKNDSVQFFACAKCCYKYEGNVFIKEMKGNK